MRRLRAAARVTAGTGLVAGLVHEPELDRGRRRQDLVQFRRVLHAGQLHDDAVDTLPLHERFGDAQFVDTIPERRDVLLDRKILACADLRLGHPHGERLVVVAVGDQHLGIGVAHDAPRGVVIGTVGDPHGDGVALEIDAVAYPRLAQPVVEILLVGLEPLLDRRLHVDLEQHVDTAAQVQAQAHRIQPQGAYPPRQLRRQREGDIEITAVTVAQSLARRGLRFRRLEPQHGPVVFQVGGFRAVIRALQRADELAELSLGNRFAETVSQLDGRNAAVKIGQGQQDARQQYDEHQHVEPGGILVHRNGASSIRLLRRCPWARPARRSLSES